MIYRQRPTFADDFLLQTIFPFLDSRGANFLLKLARYWNAEVPPLRSTQALAASTNPLRRVSHMWRKVAEVLATATIHV